MVFVKDKPQVRCQPEYSGIVGQPDFEVICTGRSNPVPHRIVWSWTQTDASGNSSSSLISKTGERVEIFNGNVNKPELQPVSLKSNIITEQNYSSY